MNEEANIIFLKKRNHITICLFVCLSVSIIFILFRIRSFSLYNISYQLGVLFLFFLCIFIWFYILMIVILCYFYWLQSILLVWDIYIVPMTVDISVLHSHDIYTWTLYTLKTKTLTNYTDHFNFSPLYTFNYVMMIFHSDHLLIVVNLKLYFQVKLIT